MNILGVHFGHDSSVCLLSNGCIKEYYLSERFTGKKHDNLIRIDQLNDLIKKYNVDAIAVSSLLNKKDQQESLIKAAFSDYKHLCYDYSDKHHVSHSSIAYHNSRFSNALVFVVDGAGSCLFDNNDVILRECESIYKCTQFSNECLYKKRIQIEDLIEEDDLLSYLKSINYVYDYASNVGIGSLYDHAAIVMGNTLNDCGKAMGLASYGKTNSNFQNIFLKENTLDNSFFQKDYIKNFLSNPANNITESNYKIYADFCYEVQQQTQKALGDLVEKWSKETGIKNICISGGYGMNVVANYYLLKRFPKLNFHFEPLCNDSGVSIGAAMHLYSKLKKWHQPKVKPYETTSFHGYSYSYSDILDQGVKESTKGIANKLNSNKSVAVYNGKSEAGQRALGNRSILFNALNPDAKEIVNRIKNREWYRPFAAVVLEEDAGHYFDVSLMTSSPYMTIAFPTKTDIVPGVTHVDNTCRVQTVTSRDEHLYDLLVEFKKLTGHGILLNTSLNLAGDPLVESPSEAFGVLMSSDLDYLWFPEIERVYDHLLQ